MEEREGTSLVLDTDAAKKAKIKELIAHAILTLKATEGSIPEVEAMSQESRDDIALKEQLFVDITTNISLELANKLSKQERAYNQYKEFGLAYGEIVRTLLRQ